MRIAGRDVPQDRCLNRILRKSLILLGMISLVSVYPMQDAAHAKEKEQHPVSSYWVQPSGLHYSQDSDVLIRRGASLTPVYDARDNGWITSVKDQGRNQTCWAFSSIAAMEANLIKNGKADTSIDLSENQFAYFFYNRKTDALGYTKDDYNLNRNGNYLSGGGTLWGSGLALATWAGVTTEDRCPYLSLPSEDLCYEALYSVRDVYMYEYDAQKLSSSVATVKQAILDHGAVAAGINFDTDNYYNEETCAYYYPEKDQSGNHAVTIIGWNDGYSRENFVTTPSCNGAWIVKNSYGVEFGDQGYNYVSYEDASLGEMMAFEVVTKAEQYDNNYQHDGTANPAFSYNKADWYANVFTAKGANGYNEDLKAVGIDVRSVNTKYEIQVYTGLTSILKPTSGTKVFSSTVKGTFADAGYHTVVLPKAVSLTAGERFSVVVRLTDQTGSLGYLGIDASLVNKWINFVSSTKENQSFIKVEGSWYDLGTELGANARIKAYTNRTKGKSVFTLSSKTLGVSKGSSEKLSLNTKVSGVHRDVTWKSLNKSVAEVSAKGIVKGKAAGTTTVTAVFVQGAKKKVLKCKVTVGPSRIKGFYVTGGKKLSLKWSKNEEADGFEVYYAKKKDGTFKKLMTVESGGKTAATKKLASGKYYFKMRPYANRKKKKLYGSFTAVKGAVLK